MTVLVLIGLIVLLGMHISLRTRVYMLEERLRKSSLPVAPTSQSEHVVDSKDALTVVAAIPSAAEPEDPSSASRWVGSSSIDVARQQLTPIPAVPVAPSATKAVDDTPFFLYTWFAHNALIKIGAIIFFLGAVWFVSYAIEQRWIAPILQIMLGIALSVLVGAVGAWRATMDQVQYQVLTVLSGGILFGTVVASQFAFATPIIPALVAGTLLVGGVAYLLSVAFKTETEWLAIVAAVAGLLVPLLTKVTEPDALGLLVYLLVLSAGLLAVVIQTPWRFVTTVLVIGTTGYTSAALAALPDWHVWVFVCLFTALFYASTILSVLRFGAPRGIDVAVLAFLSLQFIGFATTIAFMPSVALFVAASITALMGYVARAQNHSVDTVSLFALLSLLLSLVATTELLDGSVLTIALALEATIVTVASLYVATVKRSVYVALSTFALPIIVGLADINTLSGAGATPLATISATLVVLLTIFGIVVWMVEHPALRTLMWVRQAAGGLLAAGMGFGRIVTPSIVSYLSTDIMYQSTLVTLIYTLGISSIISYVVLRVPAVPWRRVILLPLLFPVLSACTVLAESRLWAEGIWHAAFGVSLLVAGVLALLVVLYAVVAKREWLSTQDSENAYALVWLFVAYSFWLIGTVSGALFSGTVEVVLRYFGQAILLYVVINTLLQFSVRARWISAIGVAYIIPVLQSLGSFHFTGWPEGVLSIDAIGLYGLVTLATLLGVTCLQQASSGNARDTADASLLTQMSLWYFWFSGIVSFCLVWMMAQSAISEATIAVTVALFIYTVVGLLAYSYGRLQNNQGIKRAGILLLAAVIVRLGLIDVWGMELLWRIVTFMGIGASFIVTALLERPVKVVEALSQEHDPRENETS